MDRRPSPLDRRRLGGWHSGVLAAVSVPRAARTPLGQPAGTPAVHHDHDAGAPLFS